MGTLDAFEQEYRPHKLSDDLFHEQGARASHEVRRRWDVQIARPLGIDLLWIGEVGRLSAQSNSEETETQVPDAQFHGGRIDDAHDNVYVFSWHAIVPNLHDKHNSIESKKQMVRTPMTDL
jgi:hypothetical protein